MLSRYLAPLITAARCPCRPIVASVPTTCGSILLCPLNKFSIDLVIQFLSGETNEHEPWIPFLGWSIIKLLERSPQWLTPYVWCLNIHHQLLQMANSQHGKFRKCPNFPCKSEYSINLNSSATNLGMISRLRTGFGRDEIHPKFGWKVIPTRPWRRAARSAQLARPALGDGKLRWAPAFTGTAMIFSATKMIKREWFGRLK